MISWQRKEVAWRIWIKKKHSSTLNDCSANLLLLLLHTLLPAPHQVWIHCFKQDPKRIKERNEDAYGWKEKQEGWSWRQSDTEYRKQNAHIFTPTQGANETQLLHRKDKSGNMRFWMLDQSESRTTPTCGEDGDMSAFISFLLLQLRTSPVKKPLSPQCLPEAADTHQAKSPPAAARKHLHSDLDWSVPKTSSLPNEP